VVVSQTAADMNQVEPLIKFDSKNVYRRLADVRTLSHCTSEHKAMCVHSWRRHLQRLSRPVGECRAWKSSRRKRVMRNLFPVNYLGVVRKHSAKIVL